MGNTLNKNTGCSWQDGLGTSPTGEQCGECNPEFANRCPALNKEKQIEGMANDICKNGKPCSKCSAYPDACKAVHYAERFYNAGYRKASEVAREIFGEIENILAPTISALFMTSETLVDVSKSHISEEKAIKDIRNYLHNAICSKYQLEKALAELKKKYTGKEE